MPICGQRSDAEWQKQVLRCAQDDNLFLLNQLLFDDAGDYVVVVGFGDLAAVEGAGD